jgi:hypothetical protein
VMSSLETLSRGDPDCFPVQKNHLPFVSVFGESLFRKSNTVILFRLVSTSQYSSHSNHSGQSLLLHEHEPSRALFVLCLKSLLMSLLPASE